MSERFIEIEADSLSEAEMQLHRNDFIVLEASILCNGRVEIVQGIADTVEEAVVKAQSGIPADAKIETQKIKVAPKRFALQAEGDNEESAEKQIGLKKAEVIESVSLHRKGRRGFLGFLKTPNVYEVLVSQQAVVEIVFREQARIRAKVQGYLAKDLLQRVEDLRTRDAEWTEILRVLNPKNDAQVQELLVGFRVPFLCETHTMLNTIEDACRLNEGANWQMAISEASYVRARELEAQRIELTKLEAQRFNESEAKRIKLRKLDHRIAEAFMIYTSPYWDKRYTKLTGIPRWEYESSIPADERERETIPRYSSDEEAFRILLNRVSRLRSFYLQVLAEEDQSEATASLEQRCIALLEAQMRGGKR